MAKILIIDDDEHVGRVLKSHLSDEGYQVTVSLRGRDGMAEALKSHPDLILLDVMLPDLTGYQLCNQFRREEATQHVPIIMMSGVARYPNQQLFGLERGANEYILKPFNIINVGKLVKNYVKSGGPSTPSAPAKGASGTPKATTTPDPKPKTESMTELRSFLKDALLRAKNEP